MDDAKDSRVHEVLREPLPVEVRLRVHLVVPEGAVADAEELLEPLAPLNLALALLALAAEGHVLGPRLRRLRGREER
eukprot:4130062-Heterocapsa_arctica.AAC.1